MQITNNRVNDTSINQNFQIRTQKTQASRGTLDAVRVELSTRALLSDEYNREDNYFPIHNEDALTYSKQMKISYDY